MGDSASTLWGKCGESVRPHDFLEETVEVHSALVGRSEDFRESSAYDLPCEVSITHCVSHHHGEGRRSRRDEQGIAMEVVSSIATNKEEIGFSKMIGSCPGSLDAQIKKKRRPLNIAADGPDGSTIFIDGHDMWLDDSKS
eukprot:CAMPEP_0169252160 /NCGR_PEP_ID=MMETSP1016-20121227/37905_1 /TAXON_ID=342587 /ORGANISM="Karlodinium micrum, Strain CCMP2283" /LENGTH=139 /DNA_ID=CAMNT_0009333359 /DNA_START=1 /DNA_END=417 /DNA_ORIENTATION=+